MPKLSLRSSLHAVLVSAVGLAACSPKAEELYARAEQSLAAGQPRAALIDLQNLLESDPQNARARALLARALIETGNINGGAIELQKAKDLGAPADLVLVPECRVLLSQGKFDDVLAQCTADRVPQDARAGTHVTRGAALMSLQRPKDAAAEFAAALAIQPDSLEALRGGASVALLVDGIGSARALLAGAPASVQEQSAYWMAVGQVEMAAGAEADVTAAEKAFATAVEKAGKSGDGGERLTAMATLAEVYLRQGKAKDAAGVADELGKAAPNNPLVKRLRGQIAAANGDFAAARTLLEEAVAAMPDDAGARLALGAVNLQQGNLGQAEQQFASVVANDPANLMAQRMLVETRSRLSTPAESLEGLKPSLADASADPAMLAMAGRLSLASGDREQALGYLSQAAERAGGAASGEVQLEVASGFMMAGDYARALELLETVPAGGARDFQRESLKLQALLGKGEKDKALAEARALLERSPDDPMSHSLAAGVYLAVGQPAEARAELVRALELKPGDPGLQAALAKLDLMQGRADQAQKGFEAILKSDPRNLQAQIGMAAVADSRRDAKAVEEWLGKAAADHPESVPTQLALANFHFNRRDFGKALAVVDAAAKKAPNDPAIASARGQIQLGLNDPGAALASFKQAASLAPDRPAYAFDLARAFLLNRNLDGALEVLNGVLRANPQNLGALTLAAAACLQSGEAEKATGYIERLRKAAPDAAATFALEGDLAMAQKRYRDAIDYYRKASAKAPNRVLVVAEYRASVQAGVARPEQVLETWLAAHPDDLEVTVLLAESKHRGGDGAGAAKLYERVLERSPDNAVVLNNLAALYDSTGNPKALEVAARAYKAAPKVPAIQDTYGWILLRAGRTEEAAPVLAEAARGLPDNAEVQYHYAALLAKQGKSGEAIALLEKAVRGGLPAAAQPEAQSLLRQLKKQ
jgi:putative PEP-CTERM system TPR-repeat lipoprotein